MAEMHKHRCSICNTVWQHSEEWSGVIWAHQCPKCSQLELEVYKGDEPPLSDPWPAAPMPTTQQFWGQVTWDGIITSTRL